MLLISACAITYELLISTLSAYLLGSSVLQFSVTIGLFMFFMGVGSYLSKFITRHLLELFIIIEVAIGVLGGVSASALYWSYSATEYYYLTAFLLVGAISLGVGLEIPLLTRIIREHTSFKDTIAHVLSFDYLGALFASLLFPLVLLPYLGLVKTAFCVGIVNILVALVNVLEFRQRLRHSLRCFFLSLLAVLLLILGFVKSAQIVAFFENFIYEDEIIYADQSPYQRIIVTKYQDDTRLYLNGNLQFSSTDEHRYHEPLVHIPLSLLPSRESILVLGGGDGLIVRELQKYSDIQRIVLVDLDKAVVALARTLPAITAINKNSLREPRLTIIEQDAYQYLESGTQLFSAIIIDLPDPHDFALGKLYSREFYGLAHRRLAQGGILVTQSSSPYAARHAFWSINHTLQEHFSWVVPYQVYIPSFGLWGFNMASNEEKNLGELRLAVPTAYLTEALVPSFFVFDRDTNEVEATINRLDNQALVTYYEQSL